MAIAFVSKTAAAENTATFSHTIASGTDRFLVVVIAMQDTNSISGVTYATVSMTRANTAVGNGYECDIWYLAAPTVGTANVVVSGSLGDDYVAAAANFTGVKQTSPVDDIDDGTGTGANPSITATPTTDGQLLIGVIGSNEGGPAVTGSGEVTIANSDFGTDSHGSSYAIQTTATAQAMNWTLGANDWAGCTATFFASDGAVAATITPRRMVLGIGT